MATLKDISIRCGVSITAVSAVLNNRNSKINCSEANRAKIFKVAKELNYHPDILAKSMVRKKSPFVLVMLHFTQDELLDNINPYFQTILANLTFFLNEYGYEIIFLPYRTEKEQLERFKTLCNGRLIGGVISNIIGNSHQQITRAVREANIPYMILGRTENKEIFSTYKVHNSYIDEMIVYADGKKLKNIFYIILRYNHLTMCKISETRDIYEYDMIDFAPEIAERSENLLVFLGNSVHKVFTAAGFDAKNKIIIEQNINMFQLPADVPALLAGGKNNFETIRYAADSLVRWMEKNEEPEIVVKKFEMTSNKDVRWLNIN